MPDYVCVTECYYCEHHFKVGDPLPEGVKANKHFMDPKKKLKTVGILRPIIAGDDPRSTDKIIKDIKGKYNVVVDEGTSRKEAFALWIKLEKANTGKEQTGGEELADEIDKTKGGAAEEFKEEVTQPEKPLSEWTPDEIDKAKSGELSKMFGIPYQGKSKEDLVSEIIKAETI